MVDIALTEEQRLLREALERLIGREHTIASSFPAADNIRPAAVWRDMVEMGVSALLTAEADGGMGGGGSEMMLVAEQLGRNLVQTPFLETTVVAGAVIEACEQSDMRTALLEQVASGTILTLAHFEPHSRYDEELIATTAMVDGAGYVIDGIKSSIVWGNCADRLLVSAMLDGGMAIFAVDPNSDGVTVNPFPTNDGQGGADVSFSSVRVDADALVIGVNSGWKVIEKALGRGRIYLACEASALMRRMAELTRDYVETRKQFGVAIGSFQVIQHRLVDMFIEAEQSLSIALAAGDAWDSTGPEMKRATSAARCYGARAGRFVAQNAVQLHGGVGMAYETPLSHYFKRLTMNGMQLGDESFHLRRYASLMRHTQELATA